MLSLACAVGVAGLVWVPLGLAQGPGRAAVGARVGVAAPADVLEVDRCAIKLIDDIELASKLPGRLLSVEVKPGTQVRAGMELGRLDDQQARINAESKTIDAESEVYIQAAQLEHEVDVAEHQGLVALNVKEPNTVSRWEQRRAEAKAKTSAMKIKVQEHEKKKHGLERDMAVQTLKDHQILSPIDGLVTDVLKDAGEYVQQGEPVFKLIRTDRLRVEGQVRIENAGRVEEGQPVEFRVEVDDVELEIEHEVFRGKIAFVDPNIEPVSRMFRVWAEVQNPSGHLMAGLEGRMRIFLKQGERAKGVAGGVR